MRRNQVFVGGTAVLAAFCALTGLWGSRKGHTSPLRAEPATITIDFGDGKREERRSARFAIENTTDRPVRIAKVLRSCRCLATSGIEGRVLGPRETAVLEVGIIGPVAESTEDFIELYTSEEAPPVSLTVRTVAVGRLPRLKKRRLQGISFVGLRSPTERRGFAVEAWEHKADENWFAQFVTDNADMLVELAGVEELPSHDPSIVQRTYTLRIGWKRLPGTKEFVARVFAIPRSKDPERIEVGTVTGTLATSVRLAPSLVRLSAENPSEAVFVMGENAKGWRTAQGWACPDWLALKWKDEVDLRILEVAFIGSGTVPQPIEIPLENEDGRRAELPIRARR